MSDLAKRKMVNDYGEIDPLTTEQVEFINICELIPKLLASKDYRHQFMAAFLMWQVSAQIRAIRLDRGWTQAQLAEKAEVNRATITRLENPRTCIKTSINTLLSVARAFDCGLVIRFAAYSEIIEEIHRIQNGQSLAVPRSQDVLERVALEKWGRKTRDSR